MKVALPSDDRDSEFIAVGGVVPSPFVAADVGSGSNKEVWVRKRKGQEDTSEKDTHALKTESQQ